MSQPQNCSEVRPLTWSLCVATLNRLDALELCVGFALRQSRPPKEIVIVDAGDNWAENELHIKSLTGPADIPVHYLKAEKRSLPYQRNQGARAASGDVLFMIDDDAYMHEDCAEKVMSVYESDAASLIAAVSCAEVAEMPGENPLQVERKDNAAAHSAWVHRQIRQSSLVRFVWREILLMSAERLFIPYDGPRAIHRPEAVASLGLATCVPVKFIPGFAMTVRREIVLKEPFEDALLSYSPTEDTEATYRFTRHGANACATDARLYHHHAAAGRIKRRQAIELTMTNLAFFVRKRSSNLKRDIPRYYLLALRRILAEALKDGLSRRWSFPQLRGTLAGAKRSIAVLRADRESIDSWYQDIQARILAPKA